MNQAAIKKAFTAQAFLEWEPLQLDRHIYFHGDVFAMAGGSATHNTVSLNLASELRSKLKGRHAAFSWQTCASKPRAISITPTPMYS